MRLYSTQNKDKLHSLRHAVLQGLPPEGGLYMPQHLTRLPEAFIAALPQYTFPELAYGICQHLFEGVIPATRLRAMVERALSFDAPLVPLAPKLWVLELFHGPTLAFKDFGARFMAELMAYFVEEEGETRYILVATSGDTGGAVAHGFFQTPGIEVIILYPQGKVSPLQERQLTSLGHNVRALELAGSFDDCQALVKRAFRDAELRAQMKLSSANSINIARLIPQSFYYFSAWQQGNWQGDAPVFCVPSGNFGNLTAGLIAHRLGLPVKHFIAATNANDVVPHYLKHGQYLPQSSVQTLSNAMDVGDPSNFVRMLDLYEGDLEALRADLSGYAFSDQETRAAIRRGYAQYGYQFDPHGAVGFLAAEAYQARYPEAKVVVLETAHPAKFPEVVEEESGEKVALPAHLQRLLHLPVIKTPMPVDYSVFKNYLLDQGA